MKKSPADCLFYDVSLSTMWAKNNFPVFSEFFETATNLGFPKIELNHQVNSKMLSGVDLNKYLISSVHEPCPSDISVETLKLRDWLISSPDEDCRQNGVSAIKRSLDLANKINASVVVVHAGQVSLDMMPEKKLRQLFDTQQKNSDEYQEIMNLMKEIRQDLIGPCLESVKQSLKELLDYAGRLGIRLGLENRYHYYDIPSQNELSPLLDLADPEQLGFIYDVGYAQALDKLGFFSHEEWLIRYGERMIGSHLHDVIGVDDHFPPGLGEVDFNMVASYLPADSYRAMEIKPGSTPEQIKTSLSFLADLGCINLYQQEESSHV